MSFRMGCTEDNVAGEICAVWDGTRLSILYGLWNYILAY